MSFNFLPKGKAQAGFFSAAEKRRFIGMAVLALIVAGAFLATIFSQSRGQQPKASRAAPPERPKFEESVATPTIDAARWNELARDATPEERVLLEGPALAQAFATAKLLRDAHFAPMGGIEPQPADLEALAKDPKGRRGQLARLRGWIEELEEVPSVHGSDAYWRGRLRLESGGTAYFAALQASESGVFEGEFARVDGFFLKLLRRNVTGAWVDAPLFVGPLVKRSFPKIEPVLSLAPDSLGSVVDDTTDMALGMQHDEFWRLVSYAANLPADAVDWSQARVLDRQAMSELSEAAAQFRGVPMRLPACQIMDVWTQTQGENPLRVARMSQGWLGLDQWIGPSNGLVRFLSPKVDLPLKRGDLVTAHGFFFKHLAYEPAGAEVAVAPTFVLHSIQVYLPPSLGSWRWILAGFGISLCALFGLIMALSARDRKRAEKLAADLRNRRKQRRALSPS
jgi:hypothetical protein